MVPGTIEQLAPFRSSLRLIATDVDGTLTRRGKFTAELLQAMAQLQERGIALLLVTGRSAGWVEGLQHYLPVTGAIAENGGIYCSAAHPRQVLTPLSDLPAHRQALAAAFNRLQHYFPHLRATSDNSFRLTDWTFDLEGVDEQTLATIARLCQDWGWGFTYSTVQGHLKPLQQDKATGLEQVLQQHFPQLHPQQILTVGDSPNDASLFDPARFPLSVGVANVREYDSVLPHLPCYVTRQKEGEGFAELVHWLLDAAVDQGSAPVFSRAELGDWQLTLAEADRHNIFHHCRHCQREWVASTWEACSCGSKEVEHLRCWQFPDG